MPESRIYTKQGDKGETSLIGGRRVPKYHQQIEAYGTVDELNSFVGLIRDQKIDKHSRDILVQVQDRLFTIESQLATDHQTEMNRDLPHVEESDIGLLEEEINRMEKKLPVLTSFILPGGHPIVSYCHIARTICRRAERIVIRLSNVYQVDPLVIKYLNRLSDYFFVLARKFTRDFDAREASWNPKT